VRSSARSSHCVPPNRPWLLIGGLFAGTGIQSLLLAEHAPAIAIGAAAVLAGPMADAVGMSRLLWIGAGWIVVTTLAVMLVRDVREYRTRDPAAETAAVPAT
jgi:hypothetical protein